MRQFFYDNVLINYENGDERVYNVVTKDNKFFLRTEDEPLIEKITIEDSKLVTYYDECIFKRSIYNILNINIEEKTIQKKYPGFTIEGTLLVYDSEMAEKYNLDDELAYDVTKFKVKKRIKEEQ